MSLDVPAPTKDTNPVIQQDKSPNFYKHKEGPVRETTEIKFKETQAQWVRIHIRGADGARVDELEIYGGSNPLSVDSASKLTTIWSQIKIDS